MHFFKNMRKRYKILIAAIILCAFLAFIYLFMTPDGALRRAVFWHGYPKKAVVMEYIGTSVEDYNANETTYAIIDPPINLETATFEENWAVTRYWCFYSARCID